MAALEATSLEVLPWLKTLPLAPEYHPTAEEFRDPIAYILKIEDEASRYGICKIVPPVPPPSKKAAAANLSRSLAEGVGAKQQQPMFTTRQQQIGFCPRKSRPVQKPVWQSGETYTLPQFEAKAKAFERAQLKKVGKKSVSPLEMETMFWKACADKPFSVEYANDMPGSAFVARGSGGGGGESLAETAWNMRGISKSKMSLLKFMKEEIPGVTSPMVYVAMMFSWFAWHVEDHDLHSLNYLHLGAGKTWYGVPRDAAVAFEEVVRVHGYGDEVNPLVTYAILGEKTTVMSPEVLIAAGVPCCRLVQNAGEFVVTFPRAYHSGFSHGFNCGEASNIATPGWLRVAKEAAIRRACISYPPMLSHFQLLYNLVLALCSSMPKNFGSEPRSSRLKDKKRGEGEMVVKQLFVEDMIQNNERLHILLKRGSSCILLPPDSFELPLSSNSRSPLGCKIKVKSRLPLGSCSRQEPIEALNNFLCNDVMPERNPQRKSGFWSASANSSLRFCEGKQVPSVKYSRPSSTDLYTSTVDGKNVDSGEGNTIHGDGLFDQGLLSCVTCGLLSYACVAVIQPSEAAAKHIMSTTCSVFNDDTVGSVIDYDQTPGSSGSGQIEKDTNDGLVDIVVQSGGYQLGVSSERAIVALDTRNDECTSALDLLASAYGDSSDSDEELSKHKISTIVCNDGSAPRSFTSKSTHLGCSMDEDTEFISYESDHYDELSNLTNDDNRKAPRSIDPFNLDGAGRSLMVIPVGVSHPSEVLWREPLGKFNPYVETSGAFKCDSKMSSELHPEELSRMSIIDTSIKNQVVPLCQTSNRDVLRRHVFCLEHAVEVERQLRPIGGGDVLLICHPDYLKVERRAKSLAKELAINCCWKGIHFREVTCEDKEKIQTAIDDEEAIPGNGDWAVKLGINLYYSSSLSKSPLYSKQMPYNEIIYRLFGQDSPQNSPTKLKVYSSKRSRKQRKVVVAGKWCGKVWMSNQVHPSLVRRDTEEQDPSKEPRYNSDSADENRVEVDDSFAAETPPAEKRFRKRKNPFEIVTTNKLKHQRSRDAISSEEDIPMKSSRQRSGDAISSEEDVPVKSSRGGKRIVRSGAVKRSTPVQIQQNKRTITSARKFDMKDETEDGPCTRLRKRPSKSKGIHAKPPKVDKEVKKKKQKKFATNTDNKLSNTLEKDEDAEYQCDMEGCSMCFSTKQDLVLHKRNICLVKGCGKKFFSHKYLVQHRRVHLDDRPLKCPWKGCKMTFKWAWARTEHVRVHTGARPYVCKEPGCGQTFRFVSDFSRHKRKTGHSLKKKGRG